LEKVEGRSFVYLKMQEFLDELDKVLKRTDKNNPLTSKQLSKIFGIIETKVSKWMKKLRKQGFIAFDEKVINIKDRTDYLFREDCERIRQKKCFVYWKLDGS
jgi:transcription initiation factor IIE alpha subunit